MKKIMSLALALVMLMSLSVTAFAADTSPKTVEAENGTATIDVTAKYVADVADPSDTYNVVVTWSGMEFTYTVEGTQTWNAETHKYDVQMDETGTWSENTATITVTNHSNVAVNATLSFAAAQGVTVTSAIKETSGETDDGVLALASAADGESLGDASKAPTASATFGITTGNAIEEDTTLGTITVKIAKSST